MLILDLSIGLFLRLKRQANREYRAALWLVGGLNGAAVREDDLLRNPQADASALSSGRIVRLENRAQLFHRHARAAVAHFEDKNPSPPPCAPVHPRRPL